MRILLNNEAEIVDFFSSACVVHCCCIILFFSFLLVNAALGAAEAIGGAKEGKGEAGGPEKKGQA